MRIASTIIIKIIEEYPLINKISYYIIGLLGVRFILSYWFDTLNSTSTDLIFSGIVAIEFIIPFFIKNYLVQYRTNKIKRRTKADTRRIRFVCILGEINANRISTDNIPIIK